MCSYQPVASNLAVECASARDATCSRSERASARLAQQRRPYPRRQPCLGLFGALQAIGPLGAPPRVVPRAAERDFASLEGEKDRFVLEQCRVSAECDELNKVMHDQQFT